MRVRAARAMDIAAFFRSKSPKADPLKIGSTLAG